MTRDAVAKKFLSEGANITICARDEILLDQAQRELQSSSPGASEVFAIPINVAHPQEVDKLIDYALSKMGGVDTLIANAGVYGTKGPIEEVDWEAWADRSR